MKTERTSTEIIETVRQYDPDGWDTELDGLYTHHDPIGSLDDLRIAFEALLNDTPEACEAQWWTVKRGLGADKKINNALKSAYKNVTKKTWKPYIDDSADFSADLDD